MRPRILGIGGAACAGSASEAALKLTLDCAAALGAIVSMMAGPDLILPLYNPLDAGRNAQQLALTQAFRHCDGLLISSPSYHGSTSGLIKNAIDYCEDLRNDSRPYIDGVPVGLIVCAGGLQGGGNTLASMRSIVHSLRGWPTPLGVVLATTPKQPGGTKPGIDAANQEQLETVARQVVQQAQVRLYRHALGI